MKIGEVFLINQNPSLAKIKLSFKQTFYLICEQCLVAQKMRVILQREDVTDKYILLAETLINYS